MGGGRAGRGAAAGGKKTGGRPSPLWLLGAAFLICWAFVLGAAVGQGYLASPEQLAALPLVGAWFEPAASAPAPPALEPKLSFYDELQRGRPASKTTARPKPKAAAAKKPAAAPAEPPAARARPPAARPGATAVKPPPPPAPPAARPPSRPRYTVQVASFQLESQAREMSRRLRRAGLPAYVRRSNVKGVGLRYRVRVGPYGDFDEAKGAAGRLRLQQRLPAYVTRED